MPMSSCRPLRIKWKLATRKSKPPFLIDETPESIRGFFVLCRSRIMSGIRAGYLGELPIFVSETFSARLI
jgi:hypothetical protein